MHIVPLVSTNGLLYVFCSKTQVNSLMTFANQQIYQIHIISWSESEQSGMKLNQSIKTVRWGNRQKDIHHDDDNQGK